VNRRHLLGLGTAALAARLSARGTLPKLGILCHYTTGNVEFAAQAGFATLELQAGPRSALDPTHISEAQAMAARDKVRSLKLEIAAFACHFNHFEQSAQDYFRRLIPWSQMMGVKVIGTHTGLAQGRPIAENVEQMKRVFTPYLELCEKHDVTLALEGWPGPQNFATTPANWDLIIAALPSRRLALEFDPSHLVRQFIDPIPVARQFAGRIVHVHAKDTEIIRPVLNRRGARDNDEYWRYRLPGFGEVRWAEFITVLLEAGYAGGVDIEHEDSFFEQPNYQSRELAEIQKEGFRAAKRYLSQFLPSG
jgi:sugar phosphate isomerase/epimerase